VLTSSSLVSISSRSGIAGPFGIAFGAGGGAGVGAGEATSLAVPGLAGSDGCAGTGVGATTGVPDFDDSAVGVPSALALALALALAEAAAAAAAAASALACAARTRIVCCFASCFLRASIFMSSSLIFLR
jgi:hypothetical protein